MTFKRGYNKQRLMANHTGYDDGLPPYLVGHILWRVFNAEKFLQDNGLCHVNLQGAANVILDSNNSTVVPSVTLVDLSGLEDYSVTREKEIQEQVMGLAKNLTAGNTRVLDGFSRLKDNKRKKFEAEGEDSLD
jgi:uncharacterized radical SAM superfamily Fe-S cluster-containing enzyme